MMYGFMAGFVVLRLGFLALFVLLAIRVSLSVRARWARNDRTHRRTSAINRLARRFATGEIDEMEYRSRRDVLAE
jgi:uncharacterized membrane protein